MIDLRSDALYQRSPGCVHRAFRGAVLVLDEGGAAFELVGASAAVWIALDSPGGLGDVIDRLDEIGVTSDAEGRSCLAEALLALASSGLVRKAEG